MQYLYLFLSGITGGLLGGMGMGGGTLLIPILTFFCGVSQHSAQAMNLISFIPMAVVALIIHIKNGYIKFDKLLYIILPGIATCILGCYISKAMSGELLKRCFGGFLLLLSAFQCYAGLKKKQ